MQVTKKHYLAASGVVAAAAIIMMFSPRRAEGQYASPVKVMNTSSAPAIGSVIDEPGRIPYLSSATVPDGFASTHVAFAAVPANHRLVLTGVSGNLPLSGNDLVQITVQTPSFEVGPTFVEPPVPTSGNYYSFFTGTIATFYVDAGQTPQVSLTDLNLNQLASGGYVTLSGYMLDCSAAPCAPIAH